MESSTSFALIFVLVLAQMGCWTGQLIETGRLHETVLSYERVALVGSEIQLDYIAEVSAERARRNGQSLRRIRRGAAFSIDDLTARPEYPVEDFPLRRLRPGSGAGYTLPLSADRGDLLSAPTTDSTSPRADWVAKIDQSEGRQIGFSLCPSRGGRCLGPFYSAALYDDAIAWWVYPIVPFAIAFDIALIPIQIFTLPPLIALSD